MIPHVNSAPVAPSRWRIVSPNATHWQRGGLLALLLLVLLVSLSTGAVAISPRQVLAILLSPWLNIGEFEPSQAYVLLAIRLPRVLMGTLIGASLATAGAALQGLMRNPLADAGLIGVSSGAALFVVAFLVLGQNLAPSLVQLLGNFALPLVAFVGGLCACGLVYRLAERTGQIVIGTLLLAGMAVNALAGAGTGLLTFIATDAQLRNITFWALGSLGGATWANLIAMSPYCLVALVMLFQLGLWLDIYQLGEGDAFYLGLNVVQLKRQVMLFAALAVGASVAFAGAIGFVGLIVPNLIRLIGGPSHRQTLVNAALLGASLLLGADLVARTSVAPAELPLGVVTAMIGAPFFMGLLVKKAT